LVVPSEPLQKNLSIFLYHPEIKQKNNKPLIKHPVELSEILLLESGQIKDGEGKKTAII
jgi:hypothetical protein